MPEREKLAVLLGFFPLRLLFGTICAAKIYNENSGETAPMSKNASETFGYIRAFPVPSRPWNYVGWPVTYVYFASDGEAIKIGFSEIPTIRLKSLQGKRAKPLQFVGVATGTRDDERETHARFKHLRLTGEWFRHDPEIIDFIESLPRSERSTLY